MGVQITDGVRFHISAIPAPVLAILGYILSPDFYNLMPEKYSHFFYMAAVIAATMAPQMFKKTPSDTSTQG